MDRVAFLKFDTEDFEKGLGVSLQIWREGQPPLPETDEGRLAPNAEIKGLYQSWLILFRNLRRSRSGKQTPVQKVWDGIRLISLSQFMGSLDGRQTRGNFDGWKIDETSPMQKSQFSDEAACREFVRLIESNMTNWLQSAGNLPWYKIREQLVGELGEVKNSTDELRIAIKVKNLDIICKLPWYEWDLLQKNPQVGISFSFPELEMSPSQVAVRSRNKVRILAVLGCDRGIDLKPDEEAICSLDDAETHFLHKPSAKQLCEALTDDTGWDIFFFAGHSESELTTGQIYINDGESLEVDEFKNSLKEASENGLKIAIFNSCDGLGLARKVGACKIGSIVVMKEAVPDAIAQSFLKEFIGEYSKGNSLYRAIRVAQERLEKFKEFPGAKWLPIYFQNPAVVPPMWQELRGNEKVDITSDKGEKNLVELPKRSPDTLPHFSVASAKRKWQKLRRAFVASFAIALFILSAQWQGKLQSLELQAFDHLMRQLPLEEPDDRLLIVGADGEDLDLYDFPLPDAILAQLIDKLQQYQPSVIGLNIVREKPEKSTQYPGGEQDFINHLNMTKNLITVCQLSNSLEESYPPLEPAPKEWVGFSDFSPDNFPPQNPIIRRLLLTRTDNKIVTPSHCNSKYSFAFLLAYKYLARQGIPVESVGENWKFGSSLAKPINIRTVGYQNLDASGNQLLIRYRHTKKPSEIAQKVTVREVLTDSPSFDPDWVKDRIVIIGVTSILDAGEENTSYGRMPRLHIHAHAVSQILSAVDGDRPFLWWWPQWGNTLWIFMWSLMGSLIVLILKEAFYKWLGIIGAMGVLYSVCRFAFIQGGWIPLIPAGLALVLSALGLLFYHQIKQSFVSPSKN